MPFGGWRVVAASLKAYGYKPDPAGRRDLHQVPQDAQRRRLRRLHPGHPEGRAPRTCTGLPDAYGRGRIIGDYRRVALYGVDFLIADKEREKQELDDRHSTEEMIRLREELAEQIRSLKELKEMAASYGYDISRPAAQRPRGRAVDLLRLPRRHQAAERGGDVGRTPVDLLGHLLRARPARGHAHRVAGPGDHRRPGHQVAHRALPARARVQPALLRRPGVGDRGGRRHGRGRAHARHQDAFRMLHTLYNLGPAPEPNLTVFWSPRLPDGFKRFAIKTSIDTSSIQYESDDLMRPKWGDDCAIACCVSAMRVGKQMQFFGARVNLAKTLLYALNGGRDEMSGEQVGPKLAPITGDVLDYDEVMARLDPMMDWLAKTYVNALNIIHYMHDKYCYEAIEMALHDRDILRTLACGIAGLSHAADSLSAIKYAKVKPVRDERGLIVDFKTEGEFPCYGNNDDRADDIAKMLVSMMMNKIRHVSRPTATRSTRSRC